jgi:hypothetical protein
MWTPTTRRQQSRIGLRYETDLTHAEWAVIEPLMLAPKQSSSAAARDAPWGAAKPRRPGLGTVDGAV